MVKAPLCDFLNILFLDKGFKMFFLRLLRREIRDDLVLREKTAEVDSHSKFFKQHMKSPSHSLDFFA